MAKYEIQTTQLKRVHFFINASGSENVELVGRKVRRTARLHARCRGSDGIAHRAASAQDEAVINRSRRGRFVVRQRDEYSACSVRVQTTWRYMDPN